ncbi:MAG: ABC transporter ATP-binding protein [Clostridia bacterium]|nr:ABC transporter ATP-binding protein [Clostridia bacterium]
MKHWSDIIKPRRGLTALFLAEGILAAFLMNYGASVFRTLIDRLTAGTLTAGAVFLYASVLGLSIVVNYLDEYPSNKLEHGIHLGFKMAALGKAARIDYQAYRLLGTGRLVQRIENGAAAGKGIVFEFWFRLAREIVPSIVFSMLFIYRINRTVMLTILLGYVLVFFLSNLLLKALYRIKERILVNEENLNHLLVRGLMEMVVFRLHKRFPDEIRKASAAGDAIVSAKVRMKMIHEAFFAAFALLILLVKAAIILFGWRSGAISVGGIVALVALVDNAYTPVAIFNVLYVQYRLDRAAFRRYADFLDLPDDPQLGAGERVEALSGGFEFDGVRFEYAGQPVFEQLDLSVRSGESLAFVGESGSGKSTAARLLAGLLKPTAGAIRVDGKALSALDLDSYYEHIAYIPQESPVFDGTLRENVGFDRTADDGAIREALEKAGLGDWTDRLADGLDTPVGERGYRLSGGERQRLALARLWFSPARIVILDEATSALDNVTEEKVMSNVLERLRGRTVLVIAHRLAAVTGFERIVVFRDGRVLGQGNHERLLEDCPYYRELVSAGMV